MHEERRGRAVADDALEVRALGFHATQQLVGIGLLENDQLVQVIDQRHIGRFYTADAPD